MKVAELTPEELETLIRDTVAESLADLLSDPDATQGSSWVLKML